MSPKKVFLTNATFYRKWAIEAGWLYDPQETYYEPVIAPVGSYSFIYEDQLNLDLISPST